MQRTAARQQILSAIDELLDCLVFQADCLQRFDGAGPVLIPDRIARLAVAITSALLHYWRGTYWQVGASLAAARGESRVEWPAKGGE